MNWEQRMNKERAITAKLIADAKELDGKSESAGMLTDDIFDLAIMLRAKFEDLGVVTYFEVTTTQEDGSYGTNYNRVNAILTVKMSYKDFTALAIGHKLSALTDSDAFEDFTNEVKENFMERYMPDEVDGDKGVDYGMVDGDDDVDVDTGTRDKEMQMSDGSTYTIVD